MQNPLIWGYAKARIALAGRRAVMRRGDDRGNYVEYAAVIVLIAAIAAAVLATNIGQTIADALTAQVDDILGTGATSGDDSAP
ncbi:hypothetical protein [Marinitenerispora sediminis]|uniref:Flp family type IVb pilin n=1 Tax=Marinitenerispora sediminis TaxID=1931232 RepID=A0A368T6Z4_9ACTN|nr:hypothetical protein [Marinitenerispora sediminis]RCV57948.1 hypothetical protein DEF28_00590 [Marinitenerispora sediminis]RCV59698.1 hypothetical protein DEF24_09050 [Marinitenerispora sediminis]RCV62319.1 hypothetical protein DEF23_00180 [Marinitenerispora sediminis]